MMERSSDKIALDQSYRLIFDANPIPMYVMDLETLGFLEVNEAAVRDYGYSRQEFLSMRVTDIRPVDDVPRFLKHIRSGSGGSKTAIVLCYRKKDGTVFTVEITAFPLLFAGRQSHIVLAIDVTERLDTQAEMAAQNRLATLIAESSPWAGRTPCAMGCRNARRS